MPQDSRNGAAASRSRRSTLVNRNVTIDGRRTSIRLEPLMWDALGEIARREGTSVSELCDQVNRERAASTLTAGIRVYVVSYFRAAATEQGHEAAGHGSSFPAISLDGSGEAKIV